MAIVTLDGPAQSSSAIAGYSTTYIVNKILSRQPGIPDTLVNSELQDVLRHFYTMSTGWRDTIGPFQVSKGVTQINFNPVDQYRQIQRMQYAYLYPSPNGAQFPAKVRLVPRQIIGPDTGPPSTMFMKYPDVGILYPSPDKTYGALLFVFATLIPVVNTTRLPNIAITDHLDALMWGTMARLYRMKGKPWSDPVMAGDYHRMYTREIMRVRDEANRAYSNIDTPFRFPSFAPRHIAGSPIAVAD